MHHKTKVQQLKKRRHSQNKSQIKPLLISDGKIMANYTLDKYRNIGIMAHN